MENTETTVTTATTTAGTIGAQPNTAGTIGAQPNYAEVIAQMKAENERLKNAISKTNSENAEYKRKEAESKKKAMEELPEIERLKAEFETLKAGKEAADKEIARYKAKNESLANGFTNEESDVLLNANCPIELIKPFAEIIKARLLEQEKSFKANGIKQAEQSKRMGAGTTATESDFKRFQAKKAKNDNSDIVEL
nr:MAG TPA: hypothetical protein [Caudoviricetes sp.]